MSGAAPAMENVKDTYAAFHERKSGVHTYPTEWVVRGILGKYPNLSWKRPEPTGSRILDLGFGDCRNMPLLHNAGFDIHGVEISREIVDMAAAKLGSMGIQADLRVGSNADLPFADRFFDFVLACHSCYYVDRGTSFRQNLSEIARVLRPGGALLASLPAPGNFILKDARALADGHVEIRNDVFGLRNGYTFRTFDDVSDVVETFSGLFENISVAQCEDDYWGLQINYFVIGCNRA